MLHMQTHVQPCLHAYIHVGGVAEGIRPIMRDSHKFLNHALAKGPMQRVRMHVQVAWVKIYLRTFVCACIMLFYMTMYVW